MKRHPRVLIVVPTYNERENLEEIHRKILRSARFCDLLVVDDNSPDGTGHIADRLARRDRRVKVLHRKGKQGLGTAYLAGFRWALEQGYDAVISMDADLSHNPENVPRMVDLLSKHDLIIGSRYVKDGGMVNWGVRRLFISTVANTVVRRFLGLSEMDCTGGFKCYKASLLRKIDLDGFFSKGYAFQVEVLVRARKAGAHTIEIPIIFVNRYRGKSKLNFRELAEFAWTLLRLRFST